MIKGAETVEAADFVQTLVAGESLSANDAVYVSAADGKAYKCDADDTAKIAFIGFAQEATTIGGNVLVVVNGLMTTFSGLTTASIYYLSGTPGAITLTPPAVSQVVVGRALSATVLRIEKQTPALIADIDTTDATLLNSTTETTVYTKVYPAGSFSASSVIRILANGALAWSKLNAPVVTVKVKLNGTTVGTLAISGSAPGGSATVLSYTGYWEALLINNASLAAQKTLMRSLFLGDFNDDSALTVSTKFIANSENTSSVDTAGAVTLTITYTNGAANAGTGWVHSNVRTEKIG